MDSINHRSFLDSVLGLNTIPELILHIVEVLLPLCGLFQNQLFGEKPVLRCIEPNSALAFDRPLVPFPVSHFCDLLWLVG